ncbi:MAG TPA: glycosyltransferase family A protein [Roseomonas sp.]
MNSIPNPSRKDQVSVSAVICTRNRSESLSRTLQSLLELDLPDGIAFELIVVDHASTDDTPAVLERFRAVAPFELRPLSQTKGGLSHARNRGLGAARGDLILCTDDDCLVSPDWVRVAIRLLSDDRCKLIGGRVELQDRSHLPLSIKTDLDQQVLRSEHELLGFMHGANIAFGREVVDRIGPFDVRLGPGTKLIAAEDTDFVYRAYIAGIPVRYEPDLLVCHDHRRTDEETYRRFTRGYAFGAGGMAMKHALAGRLELARIIYWDLAASFRNRRPGKPLRDVVGQEGNMAAGALRFLLTASWKAAR